MSFVPTGRYVWLSLIRIAKKRKAASKRAVTAPWVPFTVSLSVSFVYKSMSYCFRASLPNNRATLCNGDPMEAPCRRGHRGGALRGRGDLLWVAIRRYIPPSNRPTSFHRCRIFSTSPAPASLSPVRSISCFYDPLVAYCLLPAFLMICSTFVNQTTVSSKFVEVHKKLCLNC